MEYKFNFKTEEEKEKLIQENPNLTLIKIAYHLGESYLIFTDEEIEYELNENDIEVFKSSTESNIPIIHIIRIHSSPFISKTNPITISYINPIYILNTKV